MTSIHRKKKGELVELAQSLKVAVEGRREDLESRIQDYLNANETSLASDPRFQQYFPATASAVKSPSRRKSSVTKKLTDTAGTLVEDATSDLKSALSKRSVSGAVEKLQRGAQALIPAQPPSPAQMTTFVERKTSSLYRDLVKSKQWKHLTPMHNAVANVVTVDILAVIAEAIVLIKALLPLTTKITLPAVPGLVSKSVVHLPDLFALLSTNFWYPFLTWTFLTVVAPLAVATSVNFNAVTSSSSSTGAARRTSAGRRFDPVTFAVVKLLINYALIRASWTAPYFSKKVQVLVVSAIGEDMLFAVGLVTLIYGFYDAIVARSGAARH